MSGLPYSKKIEAVGSVIEIFYLDEKYAENVEEALKLVEKFDDEFSRFKKGNQLGSLNSSIGKWGKVSDEMYFLLEQAWNIHQLTGGYFNIGLAEELENLGYDADYSFKPKGVEVAVKAEEKILKIEFRDGVKGKEVQINRKVELGGLGKGYVLDFIKAYLNKAGLGNYLINAGGDIYAIGDGVDGGGWKIVLENPENNSYGIGEVFCSGFFMAASSASKRKWAGGHHLLNIKGQPAMEMLAVFVQAGSGIMADAIATSLFVMGMEKAREMLPGLGVEAMLIDVNKKIYQTEGFRVSLYA